MGIRYTSGKRGNVCSGLLNTMRSHRKASTMSNSANMMPGL